MFGGNKKEKQSLQDSNEELILSVVKRSSKRNKILCYVFNLFNIF